MRHQKCPICRIRPLSPIRPMPCFSVSSDPLCETFRKISVRSVSSVRNFRPMRIARVVPEVSLDRAFDYAIPAALDAQVALGAKVRVPFKSRSLVGYVVDFPTDPHTGKLREIEEVLSS